MSAKCQKQEYKANCAMIAMADIIATSSKANRNQGETSDRHIEPIRPFTP